MGEVVARTRTVNGITVNADSVGFSDGVITRELNKHTKKPLRLSDLIEKVVKSLIPTYKRPNPWGMNPYYWLAERIKKLVFHYISMHWLEYKVDHTLVRKYDLVTKEKTDA